MLCSGMAMAQSGHVANGSHEEFVCTSGTQTRVISIYNGTALGDACRVDYTKDGKTTTVWSSKSDRGYCTTKALALVTKFAESKYSCKPEAVKQPDSNETSG
jgi:hypothetical protein